MSLVNSSISITTTLLQKTTLLDGPRRLRERVSLGQSWRKLIKYYAKGSCRVIVKSWSQPGPNCFDTFYDFQVRNGNCWRRTRNDRSSTRRSVFERCTWRNTLTTSTGLAGSRKPWGRRGTHTPCRTSPCPLTLYEQVCTVSWSLEHDVAKCVIWNNYSQCFWSYVYFHDTLSLW